MTRHKIFGSLTCGFIVCALAILPAFAQRQNGVAEMIQPCVRAEQDAQAENTVKSWNTAGDMWLTYSGSMGVNKSHQDWVKDSLNPAGHDFMEAAAKRAIACFLKAYELEGIHDTPHSRDQSQALRSLSSAYLDLTTKDPGNSTWYYLYGEAQSSQGLYKQATPYLKKAVALGGAGGTKASELMAHSKTYLAHQLANDQALWNHNEAVDKYNAAHYKPTKYRGPNANGMYSAISGYQANHGQTSTGHW
jgi:hypothetical protein